MAYQISKLPLQVPSDKRSLTREIQEEKIAMNEYLSSIVQSGQVNTPPGSYLTIKDWIQNSFINQQSKVLEIGCSNGFISIAIARYTGATCVGIDLHNKSIGLAKTNIDHYVADRASFQQGDAGHLPFNDNSFSHVVLSGHLPFIDPATRQAHIQEALRVLKPWGNLLVAMYYYHTRPPQNLVDEFNAKIGTQLSPDGDKVYWTRLFEEPRLSLEYESEYKVLLGDEARVQEYLKRMTTETRDDWREFLRLFNDNGRFIAYFVRVYRRLPNEKNIMVQIPRGGIYNVRKLTSRRF